MPNSCSFGCGRLSLKRRFPPEPPSCLYSCPARLLFLRACVFVLTFLLASLAARPVVADPPSVQGIRPLAVRPGASVELALRGANFSAQGLRLWSYEELTAEATNISQQGDSATLRVDAPSNTPPGVLAARVFGGNGVSEAFLLLVDDLPSVSQDSEARELETAQPLDWPVAVDGAYAERGYDFYKIAGKAGQSLSLEVAARRLGSPIDPSVRLLNADGREIAYSDDELGLDGDCRLSTQLPSDGDYYIEVRDVRYRGGEDYFYRLRIGDFPLFDCGFPPSP